FLDLAQNSSFLRQEHISTLNVAFATGCEAPGLKEVNFFSLLVADITQIEISQPQFIPATYHA
ncbi:MAG: hypothetical protein KAR15_12295, partial [Desulfobacterales bacterium]|nr:hypothetical protein [Desulfobacterales bacterium]